MKTSIQSTIQLLCLSLIMISCSESNDSGHVIVKPKEVISNQQIGANTVNTKADSAKIDNSKSDSTKEVDKAFAEVQLAQIEKMNEARNFMNFEILEFADERLLDELLEIETKNFVKLKEVVDNKNALDIDNYTKAVDDELENYKSYINIEWSILEDKLESE